MRAHSGRRGGAGGGVSCGVKEGVMLPTFFHAPQ